MNHIILDTMNDIINQVETREWNRLNEHRDRVVKKWKKEKEKVEYWKNATGEAEDKLDEQMKVNEEMSENWEVATEKIGQENSDLHNEIKKLKDELRVKHPVIFQKTYQKQRDEIEKLKFNLKRAEDALDEQMEKNEDLMEKLTDK
jgi:chromosome segregation ATPase